MPNTPSAPMKPAPMMPVGTDAPPAKMANDVLLPAAPRVLVEPVVSRIVVVDPVARALVPLTYVPFTNVPFENTPVPYAVGEEVLLIVLFGVM